MRTLFDDRVTALVDGQYLHWDSLRYHKAPKGLSNKEWWFHIKSRRRPQKRVPLTDKRGEPFWFTLVDPIPERLHEIDLGAEGLIQMPDQITSPETRDQYYVSSLLQEAITSSQLEGAATTRRVAKQMIRSGRKPSDRSEQMILNNYVTMERIGTFKDKPLTSDLVFQVHRLITDQTLDDPSAAGRLRTEAEHRVVGDPYGEVLHDPPKSNELAARMRAMCSFANGDSPQEFIHPALRSIILHFWLAYDHPFVEGNGRAARALFYWSMLRHRYWLFEYVSISQVLVKAPSRYALSFLHTETDENDLTYFILYQLEVIRHAIDELHLYIKRRTNELQLLDNQLRGVDILNHRQRALIGHAFRHPHQRYTIEGHRVSQKVVYQTARADLLDLRDRGLMEAKKVGKTWHFTPVKNLEARLAELS